MTGSLRLEMMSTLTTIVAGGVLISAIALVGSVTLLLRKERAAPKARKPAAPRAEGAARKSQELGNPGQTGLPEALGWCILSQTK